MTPEQTKQLPLAQRVRLIAKGLLLFKWWFGVDHDILPEQFYSSIRLTN
jgi:hypothetical protein